MKVFYDPAQKKHVLSHEIISGKRFRHNEKRTRIDVILKTLKAHGGFEFEIPETLPRTAITAVHDKPYVDFLERSEKAAQTEIIWPYVFPCDSRIPLHDVGPLTAGYFCFDVGTPIMADTWTASIAAASSAFSAATYLTTTGKVAYALARPPGHHASQNKFGGYCYLNNAAIAAKYLGSFGKVLLLDFDFHHGNGTQSIFYDTNELYYLSLHSNPLFDYPYFTGYENEIGIDAGEGYNLNIPLEKFCGAKVYFAALEQGLEKVFKKFQPDFLVISAGFDIADNDPIGHFHFSAADFAHLGKYIKSLNKKTIIIQEGGYLLERLGQNVLSFLSAFM